MTVATAPAQNLMEEISTLQAELSEQKAKLKNGQGLLAALEAERGSTAEKIARGTLKPEAASEVARKIEQAKSAILGHNALIADTQKKYNDLYAQKTKIEMEAERVRELAEVSALKIEGLELIGRVVVGLEAAIGGDLTRYAEIRKRLSKIMDDTAKRGGFPIPPAAIQARSVKNELGK